METLQKPSCDHSSEHRSDELLHGQSPLDRPIRPWRRSKSMHAPSFAYVSPLVLRDRPPLNESYITCMDKQGDEAISFDADSNDSQPLPSASATSEVDASAGASSRCFERSARNMDLKRGSIANLLRYFESAAKNADEVDWSRLLKPIDAPKFTRRIWRNGYLEENHHRKMSDKDVPRLVRQNSDIWSRSAFSQLSRRSSYALKSNMGRLSDAIQYKTKNFMSTVRDLLVNVCVSGVYSSSLCLADQTN